MPYCRVPVVQPRVPDPPPGSACRCCVPPFSVQSWQRSSVVCPFVGASAFSQRTCRSENFRLYYERGDLPCAIEHTARGQTLRWFVNDLETLNLDYYLPIFADGLCEARYPHSFIAFQGMMDLVGRASHKIDGETLAKLIMPLKRALYTNNPVIVRRVLLALQRLARSNDGAIGLLLVPYFNQLLPRVNILRGRHQSRSYRHHTSCRIIDEHERSVDADLVRLIDNTLLVFEQCGGPDAFINIKFSIPTYEQQADVKQLSSAQLDTVVQPFGDV